MSKFSFTKQKNTAKTNVWYDSILIGQLDLILKEKKDIDWAKYRADKTLRMSPGERWQIDWKATTSGMLCNIGTYKSKEDAAYAILKEHRKKYLEESDGEDS